VGNFKSFTGAVGNKNFNLALQVLPGQGSGIKTVTRKFKHLSGACGRNFNFEHFARATRDFEIFAAAARTKTRNFEIFRRSFRNFTSVDLRKAARVSFEKKKNLRVLMLFLL
jgi:hypothetical protein